MNGINEDLLVECLAQMALNYLKQHRDAGQAEPGKGAPDGQSEASPCANDGTISPEQECEVSDVLW